MMRKTLVHRFFSLVSSAAMLACSIPVCGQQISMTHAEAVDRAQRLVARMSLDQKLAQVHGVNDATHARFVPGIPQLGIPALQVTNGPAGPGPGGAGQQQKATALPAPIALAASWDPDLARVYGRIEGSEARALGSNLLEAPDINIARVPQGGRVFEGYGEDPYLVGRLTVANIEGIQATGAMANVKHYLANNQETNRETINEIIAERPLHEIYMPAFEAAVKEAHVASVMCAYPRVNGAYNCANQTLLQDVLKRDWKFDGFVTSDFGAVHSTVPSALAGLDLELPTGEYFGEPLQKAVKAGELGVAVIDEMLVRRYAKMMELGWFAPQTPPTSIPVIADGEVARKIATQSMVLLKNERGLLPLHRESIKTIALLGPYAVRQMTGGSGSSHVIPLYSTAPVDGLDAALLSQTKILLQDGYDLEAAAAAAKRSDVAIVMVGDDEGEDHDHSIELPPAQNKLVAAVARANPNTVVVLKSGSAVLMPWLGEVAAVLEAWYPGEADGDAVADVLFGEVNPSGKLPLTFPRSADDTLAKNKDQYPGDGMTVHYSEGLNVGYRADHANGTEPLFPFGFGLSYTTFHFSGLRVAASSDGGATVSFLLTNTGKIAGAEVAQIYVDYPAIAEGNEPRGQLREFRKVMLAPGESKAIELKLTSRSFSYWSEQSHAWERVAGKFTFHVGDSSADTPLTATLQIR